MHDLLGADKVTERAVIGPGLMGHGIALVLAKRPGAVWLYGISDETLASGVERIAQSLGQLRRFGLVEGTDEILDRIRPTTDLTQAVAHARLVVEAVPEDLSVSG